MTSSDAQFTETPFPHHWKWFVLMISVNLVLRLVLLFTSQRYLQSDEALVGMIALDILDGKGIPIFPYGNAYGGGHIIEALLMIPLFELFGPSDLIVSLIPALESCAYVAIVYFAIYRWLGPRIALLSATLFSFTAPFVAYSFYVNGAMTTGALAWLGLVFFFRSSLQPNHDKRLLFASGAALGLAYYSFDYALFYLLAALVIESLRGVRRPFGGWQNGASFSAGFFLGALPIIIFNLTHNFENLRNLTRRTVIASDTAASTNPLERILRLFLHDLPSFFGIEIYDFGEKIPVVSWLAFALIIVALAWLAWNAAITLPSLARDLFSLQRIPPSPSVRLATIFIFILLYAILYAFSSSAGHTPRYLIPFFPFLPIALSAFILELKRKSRKLAFAVGLTYILLQMPFIILLARDTRTTEWKIATEGRHISHVANFLEAHDLATVLTPYEIKWKLMFASQRRIVCAAYLFGYDRETDYNKEVIDRVNRRGIIPVIVLDKELKFADVAKNFNPHASFDIDAFFARLDAAGVLYQKEIIGGYVVFHSFTRPFAIPDPYTSPAAP